MAKINEMVWEIEGEFVRVFMPSTVNGEEGLFEVLLDTADWEHIRRTHKTLRANAVGNSGQIYVKFGNAKHLHREVAGATSRSQIVDHINGNSLDNRRKNLRIVDQATNMQNRKGASKNSKTGVRGVYKVGNKWRFKLVLNGKTHSKQFDTLEGAAAYAEATRLEAGLLR